MLGPVEVLVLDMVRGCFGAGLVPAQALGVTTQIPRLGWPIREFQTCAGVRWVQQRGSGDSRAASQEEFSGFVSFPHFRWTDLHWYCNNCDDLPMKYQTLKHQGPVKEVIKC